MADKPTYEDLEQKIKRLKKKNITFNQAKQRLKISLKKQDKPRKEYSEPEMAVELIEKEDAEAKPVEQILIAEHIFRKAIEDSIPAGIAGIDNNGNQIYVNQAFCDMVGWHATELLKTKFPFPYWPQEILDRFKDDLTLIMDGKAPYQGIELPFHKKSGEQFWGLVNTSELYDSSGKIIGQLISVADISTQKRVESSMRDLSARLIDAQETERKLVSQELHDSIGGKLTAIKYSLEKIMAELDQDSNAIGLSLDDLLAIVHDTIEETQRIYRNLHPSILDDLGLKVAIRSLCREFSEVYSGIEIKSRIRIQEDQVQDSLKILIYRILQEALNNIAKHSRADQVSVSLEQFNQEVALVVEDNGTGFDRDAILKKKIFEKGFGLKNIKERTELFGGILSIVSAPDKGTVIRVSWPIGVE